MSCFYFFFGGFCFLECGLFYHASRRFLLNKTMSTLQSASQILSYFPLSLCPLEGKKSNPLWLMGEPQPLSVVFFSSDKREAHPTDRCNVPQTVLVMEATLSTSVVVFGSVLNLSTPNVNYSVRTAPLNSKVAFYIFIQQI